MENKKSKSAEIRSRMNHPIIDSDGQTVEFEPGFFDCMVRVAGREIADRFRKEWDRCNNAASIGSLHNWYNLSADERREQRATRSPWWALPMKNTLDHATSSLPKLLYERLDETGLDYTVLYPTAGLFAPHIDDAELRKAGCRGFNLFHSEIFREFSDRMAPVAVIPMHTPQEAIEELEYAVKELGFKAVMLAGHVVRPIPYVAHKAPELARFSYWIDNLCIDSAYDYDPVLAKCVELKVQPDDGLQLHVQPYRAFRRGRRSAQQDDVLQRRHAPLPEPQVRLPRRRSRLGNQSLRRSRRPLEKTQFRRDGQLQSQKPQH